LLFALGQQSEWAKTTAYSSATSRNVNKGANERALSEEEEQQRAVSGSSDS